MRVGSLFSGIGGLDLGLEQAGMTTVWQVEFDDWCRDRLDENFRHTKKYKDVREVGKHNLEPVDLICGGFPCQDLSTLKIKRDGLDGKRSGLWAEYFRVLCDMRPNYVVIENVTALVNDGLARLLCDLASIGFNAEWQTIRASSVGLPTRRNRLFIIAYSQGIGPVPMEIFTSTVAKVYEQRERFCGNTTLRYESLEHTVPTIPERLRVDNGVSFELSEIENAVKGYGNAVCPPVAKWIGQRILEFNKAIAAAGGE